MDKVSRRAVRLEMEMQIMLEKIQGEQKDGDLSFSVEVVDVSKTGLGFLANQKLELNTFYKAHIVFPSKDEMYTVIEVIREITQKDNMWFYGGLFVGINENDMFKIETYRLFREAEEERQEKYY